MPTPPATTSQYEAHQLRALVRLALVAWRRTVMENSTILLSGGAAVLVLVDGAMRVRSPEALDRWLLAAVAITVVLPVALSADDPLRSTRMALLPVSRRVLTRAMVLSSAPLRAPFAVLLTLIGCAPVLRVASSAAVLTLVCWAMFAYVAGAILNAYWYSTGALIARVVATLLGALGGACLYSLRVPLQASRAGTPLAWLPALLPRTADATGWGIALAALAASVAFAMAVLRVQMGHTASRLQHPRGVPKRGRSTTPRLSLLRGMRFPYALRPALAQEVAALTRHIGARVALAVVALFACAAAYGRVPGLAFVAVTPIILLTSNLLGADVPLGGLTRHRLQPETLARLRDRRLTVWGGVAAIVALFGAAIGSVLPTPNAAASPPGGALAAPVMLCYATAIIPWFGRASWWWARRYPQPWAQQLRIWNAASNRGPLGTAPLALVLFACWGAVAVVCSLLWTGCEWAVHSALDLVASTSLTEQSMDHIAWVGATLLAGLCAALAHVVVAAARPREAAESEPHRLEPVRHG